MIANVNKPTLILSHNKTLAGQLYGEMKKFFPNNAVEYFVSYYDYYQPEAYVPSSDTYIEKDASIKQDRKTRDWKYTDITLKWRLAKRMAEENQETETVRREPIDCD